MLSSRTYNGLGGVLVGLSAPLWASVGTAWAQPPAVKVVVDKARVVEAAATVTVVGTVEPRRRSRVSAEIGGLVTDMPVREGDHVTAGEVVCKLDDESLRLRLEQEEAKLAALNARHEELLAGTRPQELDRLKALFDAAAADYERWKFEMQRVERLYGRNESNEKEYRDTQAELITAELRKSAAKAEYELAVEGPRKEVIAQAAHDVAEQKAVAGLAATELARSTIHAPFTGDIVQRFVEVGEWIPEGGRVVEMVELATVLVRVDVPEGALPYVTVGAGALVKVDALGRTFEGRIKHVMRQADPNARTFPVKIELDNDEGAIAAGMFTRATVPAGPSEQVVAVPKDAIVERDDTTYVAALVPGQQGNQAGILIPVTLGADVGDRIAITSHNIEAGTPVIIRGTERMLPFPMPVTVVDELGTPVAMPQDEGKAEELHSASDGKKEGA